ncbi:MAG: YigZ family protein [Bacteroidetes bacterium]|nr:MAG: YigZ family protein [Bacteroidota bacterium]
MKDTYKTLAGESTGEFKDSGSKFIAYATPVYSEQEAKDYIFSIKKMHPKARHHCYAYRLGLDQNNYRANDDGEPSGTAGRPILGQIDRMELTNTIVVVVRYFGGVLLGTSGLINAYRESTADALAKAEIIEKCVEDIYCLKYDYGLMGEVLNVVKKAGLEIVRQYFGDNGVLEIAIRQSQVDAMLTKIKAEIAGVSLEEAEGMEEIEGVKIQYVRTR